MKCKWLRRVSESSGSEIAELAIVMPLLFTLILGIYSFGRAYNIYATVTRAAQDAARTAVAPVCANCAQQSCTGVSSQFPCDTAVAQVVMDSLKASNLDPNQVSQLVLANAGQSGCILPGTPFGSPPSSPSCRATSGVYICRNVQLNNTGSPPVCGTTVSFNYNYQFVPVPFIRMTSFNIPAQAQAITEY